MHPHLLLLMLEEWGGSRWGSRWGSSGGFCSSSCNHSILGRLYILDASIVASNDVGGGGIADGVAMKVHGGQAD